MENKALYKTALWLSVFTVVYNLAEGSLATFLGESDETLALFGFGVDSFVEVLSGIGIWHMVVRLSKDEVTHRDAFEIRALKVTGFAFYLLTAGLVLGAFFSFYYRVTPLQTRAGIIISVISILIMYWLYKQKLKVGEQLNNAAIISDAHCTKTCFYLSFILLGSSLLFDLFKWPYIDAVGSLGIAWYAYKEGKESFEKARSGSLACSSDCC